MLGLVCMYEVYGFLKILRKCRMFFQFCFQHPGKIRPLALHFVEQTRRALCRRLAPRSGILNRSLRAFASAGRRTVAAVREKLLVRDAAMPKAVGVLDSPPMSHIEQPVESEFPSLESPAWFWSSSPGNWEKKPSVTANKNKGPGGSAKTGGKHRSAHPAS